MHTTQDKIINTLKSLTNHLKSDNSLTKIEKLEKLNNLRTDGVLTESEFETLKKEILQ